MNKFQFILGNLLFIVPRLWSGYVYRTGKKVRYEEFDQIEDDEIVAYGAERSGIAVGWLGVRVWRIGKPSSQFIEAIAYFRDHCSVNFTGEFGYHRCNICYTYSDVGEFVVETPNGNYVFPKMALHYIRDHWYAPPRYIVMDVIEAYRVKSSLDNKSVHPI